MTLCCTSDDYLNVSRNRSAHSEVADIPRVQPDHFLDKRQFELRLSTTPQQGGHCLCARRPYGCLGLRLARSWHKLAGFPTYSDSVTYHAQTAPLCERPQRLALTPHSWWKATLLVFLIGWLYSSILIHLAKQWSSDANFSHGFFVPAFSLLVLWQHRATLAREPRKPSSWGLLVVAFAISVLVVGVLGAELFLSRISLLLLIAGLVIFFRGWNTFRAVLFPWAFLILMIPIPEIVFSQITFPLQMLASKVAALLLPIAGVPVLREGNVIQLPAMTLEVAEACSGVRSLLSLATLAIIYGYLSETRLWARLVLAVAAIPVAVSANSLRIVMTGLLVQYWDPGKADGFFHTFSGWVVFVVSLAMLFLVHRLLRIGPQAGRPQPVWLHK